MPPLTAVAVPATTAVRAASPMSPGRPLLPSGIVSLLLLFAECCRHGVGRDASLGQNDAARVLEQFGQVARPHVLDCKQQRRPATRQVRRECVDVFFGYETGFSDSNVNLDVA